MSKFGITTTGIHCSLTHHMLQPMDNEFDVDITLEAPKYISGLEPILSASSWRGPSSSTRGRSRWKGTQSSTPLVAKPTRLSSTQERAPMCRPLSNADMKTSDKILYLQYFCIIGINWTYIGNNLIFLYIGFNKRIFQILL